MNSIETITIDPGLAGGIAMRYRDGRVLAFAMPRTDTEILDLVQRILPEGHDRSSMRAYLEKVGGYIGRPQPGSAMFKFGVNYGFVLGLLMALGVPVVLIRPQQWQAALQLGKASNYPTKPAWKRHLRDEATRRFPHLHPTLATADALLMLEAVNIISAPSPAPCGAGVTAGTSLETKP